MPWIIRPNLYSPWKNFLLEIKESITLETGNCYHLSGNNGAGKTSFIRKVLIPFLQQSPYQQYILYVEQQIQSQFDAIKAYASIRKPEVKINDTQEMITYQIRTINELQRFEPRPLMVILDEPTNPEIFMKWFSQVTLNSLCLLYVSHSDVEYDCRLNHFLISFVPRNPNHTLITCHENTI
jgi:hypothetical protein